MISASSADLRRERARSYAEWLRQRNGPLGDDGRTLERREPGMARAEAWSWPAVSGIERERYERNLSRHRPERALDRATLWALCLAKASAAESFGASVGTNFAAASDADVAHILAHIEAEEAYHARTARCLLAALGLPAVPPPPDALTRAMVRAMAWLPEPWGGGVVVYSGEVTAAALFTLLRGSLGAVFESGGTAHELASRLLEDVIVDEEAHARFAASRLRPFDLRLTRRLLSSVTALLEQTLPEAGRLFGKELGCEIAAVELRLHADL